MFINTVSITKEMELYIYTSPVAFLECKHSQLSMKKLPKVF